MSALLPLRSVPSYPQFQVSEDGKVTGPSGRELRAFPDVRGYLRVNAYEAGKGWKQLGVHRLVCEAFHGAQPAWADLVAHGDGNPSNNRADNLRWATYLENEQDKRDHGRAMLGERHHQAKLTADDVLAIRTARDAGSTLQSLADRFGIGLSQASRIVRRLSWGHI